MSEVKTPQQVRIELADLLYKQSPMLTAEYKVLIGYTGGLVSSSMAFAYSRALNDVIKLILKQNRSTNEEPVQVQETKS